MTRAVHLGELQGEYRDAASAECEDGVASLQFADTNEGVPGSDRSAGQRGSLFERKVIRDADQALLVKCAEFPQHSGILAAAAQRSRALGGVAWAVDPSLHEDRADAVAGFPTGDLLAGGDNFSRSIRERHGGKLRIGLYEPQAKSRSR
jgi:hypothetical protein